MDSWTQLGTGAPKHQPHLLRGTICTVATVSRRKSVSLRSAFHILSNKVFSHVSYDMKMSSFESIRDLHTHQYFTCEVLSFLVQIELVLKSKVYK